MGLLTLIGTASVFYIFNKERMKWPYLRDNFCVCVLECMRDFFFSHVAGSLNLACVIFDSVLDSGIKHLSSTP